MRKFEYKYYRENDDLFLYRPDSKSKGSIEWGRKIVLDFDRHGELVGIEILDASETLADLVQNKLAKIVLENLRGCRVEVRERAGLTIIRIFLIGVKEEAPTTITVPSLAEAIAKSR